MQRVTRHRHIEPLAVAFDLLPPRMAERLAHVEVLTGCDPVFVGLHSYEEMTFGRSYRDTAHVVYPFHQAHLPAARRATTLVLQRPPLLRTVVHELGHVLDEALGWGVTPVPVTAYAGMNRMEAFAEAFAAWALPFGYSYGAAKDRLYDADRRTVALFDALSVEGGI